MKIGILGGGLTGLTLGYFLDHNLDHNIEILEKDNATGGLLRSLHEDGFTFDYGGSHIIFSKDNDILDFMIGRLGDNKERRIRNTKILYKDKYVKYPFENGLCDLPLEDNYECLYYYIQNIIKIKDKGYIEPKNFKSWIYQTFGKAIAEKYLIPYNEKVWNTKTELMAVDWIENRVPQPSLEDVIKSSLGFKTEGYVHQLYYYYPKYGGIESLAKSIEGGITEKITTDFEVKSLKKEDEKWIVFNNSQERVFDKIISTIHLSDLICTLDGVPEEVVNATNSLKYNSLITIMLGVNAKKLNDFSWLYLPQEDIKINRVSFPSNFSDFVTPRGKSSVLAEITCLQYDNIWNMSDEELLDLAINELHNLKIIEKNTVCFQRVKRSKYAYVVYDLDYSYNIGIIADYLKNIGIAPCGRFSEFKYLNMDACIRSAINMANYFNAV